MSLGLAYTLLGGMAINSYMLLRNMLKIKKNIRIYHSTIAS